METDLSHPSVPPRRAGNCWRVGSSMGPAAEECALPGLDENLVLRQASSQSPHRQAKKGNRKGGQDTQVRDGCEGRAIAHGRVQRFDGVGQGQ